MNASQDDVADFLKSFKEIVVLGRGLDIIPRLENNETITYLGLTRMNCEEIILGLSVTDYCSGPEPDHTRPGSVWVFGFLIAEEEVYIKLKIAKVGGTRIAKCISFHIAQYPLEYPFKAQES